VTDLGGDGGPPEVTVLIMTIYDVPVRSLEGEDASLATTRARFSLS